MHYYVPPEFGIFEFDDDLLHTGKQVRRRFNHWNGAVDKPAQDVSLGWSADDAAVLVATTGQRLDTQAARVAAGQLALGGIALPIPHRPDSAGDTQREIGRIASTLQLWSRGPALAPGGLPMDVAVCDGFTVAYGHTDGEIVLIAAVGVTAGQFKVRLVTDWTPYGIDASKRQPLNDLYR